MLNSVVFIMTFLTVESWLLACFMHSMGNRLVRITLKIKFYESFTGGLLGVSRHENNVLALPPPQSANSSNIIYYSN